MAKTHPEIVHVASKEDFWELEQLVFLILHIDVEIELEIPARPHISNIIFPFVHVTVKSVTCKWSA